ncbi:hypothetical protein, partial [Paeniglutamicibacter terrestris]
VGVAGAAVVAVGAAVVGVAGAAVVAVGAAVVGVAGGAVVELVSSRPGEEVAVGEFAPRFETKGFVPVMAVSLNPDSETAGFDAVGGTSTGPVPAA